jgi:hypothetical protein
LLGRALINAMAGVIPWPLLKPFPVLMTRYLCGPESSQDLGLNEKVSWPSRLLFRTLMVTVRVLDGVVRLVFPEFSVARFITRVLGYQLITKLMMDQTRPLKLPEHLRRQVDGMMGQWSEDSHAPQWMNTLEDRLTVKGTWHAPSNK